MYPNDSVAMYSRFLVITSKTNEIINYVKQLSLIFLLSIKDK